MKDGILELLEYEDVKFHFDEDRAKNLNKREYARQKKIVRKVNKLKNSLMRRIHKFKDNNKKLINDFDKIYNSWPEVHPNEIK